MISVRVSSFRCALLAALFSLHYSPVFAADEIDLFSPRRGEAPPPPKSDPSPPPPPATVVRPKPPVRQGGKPFVLRGTSRMANRYAAILEAPTGGDVKLHWRPGEVIDVPGFEGYQVSSVRPREVRLIYPEGTECNDALDSGVRCMAGHQSAILSLVRRNAKAPPKAAQPAKQVAQTPAVNPFKAALERAREGKNAPPVDEEVARRRAKEMAERREKYRDFKPKKIEPSEVPPGMKVVHTPFGDRLVPER